MRYTITVHRIETSYKHYTLDAPSEDEARSKVLDITYESNYEDFEHLDTDYTISNVKVYNNKFHTNSTQEAKTFLQGMLAVKPTIDYFIETSKDNELIIVHYSI
jgi:hypothetical protein